MVEEIMKSLYVEDLVSGGETVKKVKQLKKTSTGIFDDATFQLHKWLSKAPVLESEETLVNEENWPPEIVTSPSKESLAETKPVREIFNVANISQPEGLDQLLKKWSLWKTLRICAWIFRFICNDSRKGLLSTAAIQE